VEQELIILGRKDAVHAVMETVLDKEHILGRRNNSNS